VAQPRIFISYRRKPSAMLATLLARELNARGIDAFVDTRRTDGGGPFPDRLLRAIETADLFVCLLGEDTLASDWVQREIEHAHAQGKILIPVFQESYTPPAEAPEVGGAVHALLQSDGVHVMDVKNIYVDQAIDSLATMIHKSMPHRGPRRRLLAGLGVLAVAAIALIFLILSNVLTPPAEGIIPDASQAALTLTAAAETRTALAATAATAETVLGGRDPAGTLTAVVITRTALVDVQNATRTALGPPPTETLTPTESPAHTLTPTATQAAPETDVSFSARDIALQRAHAFQGGNDDWESYIETFTFDNGVSIDLALVPGGCFRMGNDSEAHEGADDGGEQCFDEPFWIGRYELTNAEYMQCVDVGACDGPYDFGADFNAPDQPVVGVDWFMARQYVEWLSEASGLSFSLPTEAEWEYAARGPDAWFYPWGNNFDGVRLNYCDSNCAYGWRESAVDDGYETTAPSGSYSPAGDSWVAVADMAGNVWEWTSTIFRDYPYDPGDGRENPADTSSGLVARGGSWGYGRSGVHAASRYSISPVNGVDGAGLRVVCRPLSP
jgi:formylglycine-generating enzyme required for sulfatase activity